MPGNAIGRPSGNSGIAGKRGGLRILIANIGRSLTGSSWNKSVPTLGNIDGSRATGAHFSSARNKVNQRWIITGITKDSTGAALGNCTVTLFKTVDNMPTATTVSDDSGNYLFSIDGNAQARFSVSYKAGSPDVAGTTVNTLIPVLT